jgi:APA family basic amino acid/polyamine antiporter
MMKEPGKTFPKAVLVSTLVSIVVYCSVAFLAIAVVPSEIRSSVYLLIYMGEAVMGTSGQLLVVLAWTAAALMSLATSISVQTSVISALSRDGYLPSILFSPSGGSMTRYIAHFLGSFLAILFTATGLIVFVGYATSFASLIVFAIVNLSLIKLRRDKPDLDRPFKTPLYPYTPIAGIIVALALMVFVEGSAIVLVLELIMIALMIYHLKMVGYERLRLAAGGINIGLSGFILLILFLSENGALNVPLLMQNRTLVIIVGVFLAVVFFLAGILNLAGSDKKKNESIRRLRIGLERM